MRRAFVSFCLSPMEFPEPMRFCGRARGSLGGRLKAAVAEPRLEHAFTEAALVEEIIFEAPDLLVEEVVGLVDETHRDIRDDLGWAGLAKLPVGRVSCVRFVAQSTGVESFF